MPDTRPCMTSEFFPAHPYVMPHIQGAVVDFGCGGLRITQTAIGVDYERHYDNPETDKWAMPTDATITCGWERFVEFCEEVGARFDVVFSSHLLEDFEDAYGILARWVGIVRPGGKVVLVLPIEQEFHRQDPEHANEHHKQDWAGAEDFLAGMPLELAQRLEVLEARDGIGRWSFLVVLKRLT